MSAVYVTRSTKTMAFLSELRNSSMISKCDISLSFMDTLTPVLTLKIKDLKNSEPEVWYSDWIQSVCASVERIDACHIVVDEKGEGEFLTKAVWPASGEHDFELQEIAQETLEAQQTLVKKTSDGNPSTFSVPLFINSQLRAVVCFYSRKFDDKLINEGLLIIEHALAWVELKLCQQVIKSNRLQAELQSAVIESIAELLSEKDFKHAVQSFSQSLARKYHCEKTVIGFVERNEVKIVAVSDTSEYSKKFDIQNLIQAALQEAVDQKESVCLPGVAGKKAVSLAHQALQKRIGTFSFLSVPLVAAQKCYGAVFLQRDFNSPFGDDNIQEVEALSNFCGLVLEEKRLAHLPLYKAIARSTYSQLSKLFGFGHMRRKLALLAAGMLVFFFSFASGPYNISADAVIEGEELRSLVAPFDAYLLEANFKAGDTVSEGDTIYKLDTREYRLQRISWLSQQAAAQREYEEALAQQERAQVQISSAKIKRAQAEIELLDFQINQAEKKSPFSGTVITGDQSQNIGSLIRQGEVLFELSPSGNYRLALYVEEYRINEVHIGHRGTLVLAALPNQSFEYVISRINPMAEFRDGKTSYRVEAEIERDALLRVGLEGVAKVHVGERLLIDTWTRGLRDWLRMALWRFWG